MQTAEIKLLLQHTGKPETIRDILKTQEVNTVQNHKSQPPERKPGWPDGDDDVINKYGTYEVQRTNGMENPYPMVAQGLSPQDAQKQLDAAKRWKKK